jgi:hypothetical protein
VCGQSCEPNQSGCDGNEYFKADIEFVVARSDTAKLLQACKEPLNQISTFIDMLVMASDHLLISFRLNYSRGVHCFDAVNEVVGIKGFVGHDSTNVLHAIDEIATSVMSCRSPPLRRKRARLHSPSTAA